MGHLTPNDPSPRLILLPFDTAVSLVDDQRAGDRKPASRPQEGGGLSRSETSGSAAPAARAASSFSRLTASQISSR